MSASRREADDAGSADDSSSKGRVRKSKKPEIQLYQPRALREKLRGQPNEPAKSPQEVTSPKPQAPKDSSKGDTREREEPKRPTQPLTRESPAAVEEAVRHGYESKEKSQSSRSSDSFGKGHNKKRDFTAVETSPANEIIDKGQVAKSPEIISKGQTGSSEIKGQGNIKIHEMPETKMTHKYTSRTEKSPSFGEESKPVHSPKEYKVNVDNRKHPHEGYDRRSSPKNEGGFADNRNSENKGGQNKERSKEKLQRKRGRNASFQEQENLSNSLSEAIEIKSAEFYPSSFGKKEADRSFESVKGKHDGNNLKPTLRSEYRTHESSEKRQDKTWNDRGNRKSEESLYEGQSGKSYKGNSPQQRWKKGQNIKGDDSGRDVESVRSQKEIKPKDLGVLELAAKVDKLSFEKSLGKEGSLKKGRETFENTDGSSDFGRNVQKGRRQNGAFNDDYYDSSDRGNRGRKDLSDPMQVEKTSKAKSYSGLRENRKNRSGNKSSVIADKQNIEVTVSRDGLARTAQVKKDSRLLKKDAENERHQMKLKRENDDIGWGEKDDQYSGSSKHLSQSIAKPKLQSKNHNVSESQDKGLIYSKDIYDEREAVEPMNFVDIPDEGWDAEVDRELIWGSERAQSISSKAPTWEDEKPPWRHERDKRRPERQDSCSRRAESPGHRGGLIQLPSAFSTSENFPRAQTFSDQAENTPVLQKHLYNPNNPSKPVPVVPSARDLPLTREAQRESSKGFEESAAASSSSQQGHSSGSHIPDNHNPKVDPTVLYNIQKGELDISYYVSSNQLPIEFRRIMDIRHHLQTCYKQLLMSDIRMCQEKNIEGALWKTLYYIIIEKLREYISREPSLKDRSLATLRMLVDEGQQYLQGLLDALQREYNFTLEDHLEEEGITNSGMRTRGIRMPLMSAQKLLLSLGDLARYKEHYSPTPNYALAKKWYHMALQVYPRNGRPFNQLAIIAANQKRPLDVVYYYVRSLTASNPFVSARDSLVSMFDDIRKKYVSGQGNEQHAEGVYAHDGRATGGESLRQEIWIRPDSGATHRRTLSQSTDEDEKDKQDDLKQLPLDQLMKRFLTSYLHCHGMLFSRVGLDEFPKSCRMMLREFNVLLHTTPPRLSTNHLLQILAINMYAVKNTEAKETRVGSGYRAAAQELSLVLAHEMFGRLVQLVVELLPHNLQYQQENPPEQQQQPTPLPKQQQQQQQQPQPQQPPDAADPQRLFTPPLAHFMPPLKAWCDWLLYQFSVWNPPPDAHEYANKGANSGGGTWCSVAELATIMRNFGPPDIELSSTDGANSRTLPPNTVLVRLTEDAFLRGYEPLLQAHKNLIYMASGEHMGRACDWARVMQLQKCMCQLLCGVDPPVLRLQKTDQGDVLVSVVDTSPPDTPTPRLSESSIEEMDESLSDSDTSDVEDDPEEGSAEEDDTPLASTVRLLTQRKKLLEKKQRQQRKLQTKLEGSVTLEMEVRPRYLVPDTNCFIEYLEVVQALAKSSPYTLMVPLVVLNELDGLSRDAAVAKYGSVGHAVRVREGAASALHYLREEKPHSVKTVTSQGSVLSSTNFTAEIDMVDATNDDKILSCCVHFCSDSTQRRPIKAGVRRLYREVVLLTEDRNLRVKAHARDVPVRNLLDFARWAGMR